MSEQHQAEYQLLAQQFQQIQQQLQALDQQLQEIRALEESLEELKTTKEGSEMFASIGAGIFVKGKIDNIQQVYLNIGAGTVVTKTLDEAKKIVGQQSLELDQFAAQLQQATTEILMKLQAINTE